MIITEYLAQFGILVTPEQASELTKIGEAYHAAGLPGFFSKLPGLLTPTPLSLGELDNKDGEDREGGE